MKNIINFLIICLLCISCESDVNEEIRTETVRLSYDMTGVDNCYYLIHTENKEFFTTDALPIDLERSGSYTAEMSFTLLNETGSCGFGGHQQKIKVISITNMQ